MKKNILCIAILVAMAGCASVTPTRYYTLNMTPSANATSTAALQVDRVIVSQALSRKEILIKKSTTEVEYYASDQWVAGLDQLVAQKLNAEFGHPSAENANVIPLFVTVQGFEQIDTASGADAFLQLVIEARKPGESVRDQPFFSQVFEIRKSISGNKAPDVVQALSAGLEEVALQLAEALP